MRPATQTMLLQTLAAARRLRRGVALLTCLAVLGWTLASATHWHEHDDAGSRGHAAAECVLCLAIPTGAAPPQHRAFVAPAPQTGATPAAATSVLPVAGPPSSYRSRAPPAA